MSPDTQVSIAFLISIVSVTFTAINFFTARKKDIAKENEQYIRISIQLENIQSTLLETKEDIKNINDKLNKTVEETVELRQQIKDMWRRLTILEEKVK